jgi:carbonic anhydrase/acetyltransferase-like protein (isoleucine patch superfamily)
MRPDHEPFIHPQATVIGDVRFGRQCSVWPSAVVRGDMNRIELGDYVSIQDNATLHVDSDRALTIGAYSLVGHRAVAHGCSVGRACLLGIGSIVLDSAEIGDGAIITAGCIVRGASRIPPRALVVPRDGKLQILEGKANPTRVVAGCLQYAELARRTLRGDFGPFSTQERSAFRAEAEAIVNQLFE